MKQKIKEEVKLRDKKIGESIKYYRKLLKVTQKNMSENLGITQQQLQKYEKGINKVSASRVEIIAEFLNLPTCVFFRSNYCMPTPTMLPVQRRSESE